MTDSGSQSERAAHGYHRPVLVGEVLQALAVDATAGERGAEAPPVRSPPGAGTATKGGPAPAAFVDGTVGGGGHAEAILEAAGPDARLVGIDRDRDAIDEAARRLSRFGDRVRLVHGTFDEIDRALDEADVPSRTVRGALLDLGVSSHQLDEASRGFSFAADGPLDMRMDRSQGPSAADLVNEAPLDDMTRWLRQYGEERNAFRIAKEIERRRATTPFATTRDLVAAVIAAFGGRERIGRIHVATRTFQALRIAVNRELELVERALPAFLRQLAPGGRLAVISFHSLEDRIVKHTFRDWATGCTCPPAIPGCVCGRTPRVRAVTRKGIKAAQPEIDENPRARSAVLRVVEMLETA